MSSAKDTLRVLAKRVSNAIPAVRAARRAAQHERAVAAVPSVGTAIDTMERRWGSGAPPDDVPIFVLAAGWRSGSTLLQRLVMSSGDALIWGEPYHRCSLVQTMADSLRGIGDDWPDDGVLHAPRATGETSFDDAWVANLFPTGDHLVEAHREFFRRLYGRPVRDGGYAHWGFKEVRLSIEHARYLRMLFPRAKLLFLVRDPYAAYRSYRMFQTWHARWPERPIITAADFGAFWRELATGMIREHQSVGGILVRYETLTREREAELERVRAYLGLPLRGEVLTHRVQDRRWPLQAIPEGELRELHTEVGALALELGYAPPGSAAGAAPDGTSRAAAG